MPEILYHVVLEGRRLGPYDRRTIVGMRVRKTLTSRHVLEATDGQRLTVGELLHGTLPATPLPERPPSAAMKPPAPLAAPPQRPAPPIARGSHPPPPAVPTARAKGRWRRGVLLALLALAALLLATVTLQARAAVQKASARPSGTNTTASALPSRIIAATRSGSCS